jgi:hypothetical protein
MYTPGESVKLIVCKQSLEASLAQVVYHSTPEAAEEFYLPSELLRRSSPVFASMLEGRLEGVWRSRNMHKFIPT